MTLKRFLMYSVIVGLSVIIALSFLGIMVVILESMVLVIPVETEVVDGVEYELDESKFMVLDGVAILDTPCSTRTVFSFDEEGMMEGIEVQCTDEEYRLYVDGSGNWSIYYVLWD